MTINSDTLRAVVFDLDGVLANTEDLYEEACGIVLGRRGLTYEEPLREQMMGRPVVDAIKIMIEAHALDESVDAVLSECQETLQLMLETSLAPMPGAIALLDRLRAANLPIAVATSALPEYADFVLTQLEIKQRFRFILTSADIRLGKPNPEIYLLAGERLGITPREFMVLEDSANGCRAAVGAGAFTVAVPNRHTMRHDFQDVRFIAETLSDPRILEGLQLPASV